MCESSVNRNNNDGSVTPGVRLVMLNLPEDEGEGLGFKLTRTMWDPYPWVREVSPGGRADGAGLKSGDCLLQADGTDLLGLPVGKVAGMIRGDGGSHGVSLIVWSCGKCPQDDPELLWSAGGGAAGERSRRALAGVLRALACAVCGNTAHPARTCARSHLFCQGCRARLARCALCREPLPPADSPHSRNLVAEQVFEAIATEYELKNKTNKTPVTYSSDSAHKQPSVSQKSSPAFPRKTVQFEPNLHNQHHYSSDSSLNLSQTPRRVEWTFKRHIPHQLSSSNNENDSEASNSTTKADIEQKSQTVGSQTDLSCQNNRGEEKSCAQPSCCTKNFKHDVCCQKGTDNLDAKAFCLNMLDTKTCCHQEAIPHHRLVARLRPASSLVDVTRSGLRQDALSRSMNNVSVEDKSEGPARGSSLEGLQVAHSDTGLFLVAQAPPIYLLACDHGH